MIIQCKSCDARFTLPDASIGKEGRRVKCGKCGNMWFVRGIAPEPEKIDETAATTPATGKRPLRNKLARPARPKPPGLHGKWLAMVAAVTVLLIISTSLTAIAVWKPLMLGLYSTEGLALTEIEFKRMPEATGERFESTTPKFMVTGKIINQATDEIKVPQLRVHLRDENNAILRSWRFTPEAKILKAGEDMLFTAESLELSDEKGKQFTLHLGTGAELSFR